MRAPGLAIAMLVALGTLAAADAPRAIPFGFDHNVHDRDVVVSGADSLPCARCHETRSGALVGKPGHAACFGPCHGPLPPPARGPARPVDEDRIEICQACHSEAALRGPVTRKALAVAYPPYTLDQDFALEIGHKTHAAVACASCHVGPAQRGAPHRRCASCHDGSGSAGKGPAMATCRGCHTPASGKPDPPALLRTAEIQIVVTSTFSHARHAARSAAGRQCITCHGAILATDDRQLPRPTAGTCATAGCHDGAASFPITAACTKCHSDVPATKFDVARPTARFSHAAHLPRLQGTLACASCHPLGTTGEVLVANHTPCVGCHAADFGKRTPTICGACHNATEPWRRLVADRTPPERSEFGATLDHDTHDRACTTCHTLTTATAQLRLPRGHRACTGSGCHARTGGPAPGLGACEACHQRGRAEQRLAARLAAPWSVRAMFDHRPHRKLAGGADVPCTSCHVDLAGAEVRDLAAPPKATCAPCHDGQTSFKLTGTTCTRCHLGARATPPLR